MDEQTAGNKTKPPNIVAQIVIVFDGKSVMVHAPMEDKIMAFGMLELARQVIHNHKPAITLAPGNPNVH